MSDLGPVADFSPVPRRIGIGALVVAGIVFAGIVIDAGGGDLTVAAVVRWLATGIATTLVVAAVVTALHALGGADEAQRRGERLAGPDVGLRPPARDRRQEEDAGPEGV